MYFFVSALSMVGVGRWQRSWMRWSRAAMSPTRSRRRREGWPSRMMLSGEKESISQLVSYLEIQITDLMPGQRLCRGPA